MKRLLFNFLTLLRMIFSFFVYIYLIIMLLSIADQRKYEDKYFGYEEGLFKNLSINLKLDEKGKGYFDENLEKTNKFTLRQNKSLEKTNKAELENISVSVNNTPYSYEKNLLSDTTFRDLQYESDKLIYGVSEVDFTRTNIFFFPYEIGDNTYNIKYEINPLVRSLKDSDVLSWKIQSDRQNTRPRKLDLVIEGEKDFPNNLEIEKFGFDGEIKQEGGKIFIKSDDKISFVRILVKFPKGYFSLDNDENKTYLQVKTRDTLISIPENLMANFLQSSFALSQIESHGSLIELFTDNILKIIFIIILMIGFSFFNRLLTKAIGKLV